jgi:type IV pilus assembly protein PilA
MRFVLALLVCSACNMVNGPPKDGECRATLRTIMAAETGFYTEQHRFSPHPAEVGFALVPGNRYLYLFDREGEVTRRDGRPSPSPYASVGVGPDTRRRPGVTVENLREHIPPEVMALLGVTGECPRCEIVVGCAGNIDADPTIDVWTISSADREFNGVSVSRGTPFHHVNDREL